ncbi:unnamed protein product [Hymenolepis diminuta]|uniref:Uncharacterized protein n=1 Tax=Hymenolepis diminuta TaxID=6216 RepID=A0A564Y6P6_HYMDI|nr:unnamed protein product [Hymenolepis diminuta]
MVGVRRLLCMPIRLNGQIVNPTTVFNALLLFCRDSTWLHFVHRGRIKSGYKISSNGWEARSEVIYPIGNGALIVTSSRRFIVPWPVSNLILRNSFEYFYLLFENEADGGSEIVIFCHPQFVSKFPVLLESIPLEPSTYLSDIIMPINPQIGKPVNYFETLRLFAKRWSERRAHQAAMKKIEQISSKNRWPFNAICYGQNN